MKAAAQMIVNSALGHLGERVYDHFEEPFVFGSGVVPQEKLVDAGIGEFRRLPQAAIVSVIGARDLLGAIGNN